MYTLKIYKVAKVCAVKLNRLGCLEFDIHVVNFDIIIRSMAFCINTVTHNKKSCFDVRNFVSNITDIIQPHIL